MEKGSDADIWLHLLSLHAAVVMFIRECELAQRMLLSWSINVDVLLYHLVNDFSNKGGISASCSTVERSMNKA